MARLAAVAAADTNEPLERSDAARLAALSPEDIVAHAKDTTIRGYCRSKSHLAAITQPVTDYTHPAIARIE